MDINELSRIRLFKYFTVTTAPSFLTKRVDSPASVSYLNVFVVQGDSRSGIIVSNVSGHER